MIFKCKELKPNHPDLGIHRRNMKGSTAWTGMLENQNQKRGIDNGPTQLKMLENHNTWNIDLQLWWSRLYQINLFLRIAISLDKHILFLSLSLSLWHTHTHTHTHPHPHPHPHPHRLWGPITCIQNLTLPFTGCMVSIKEISLVMPQ